MTWTQLYHGDCLEIMPTLEAGSVDAIITDLPYGTTACEWDSIIPLVPMWEAVKRILKPNGAFVTTASQPFTSILVVSNLKWFKYEWQWEKDQVTNPQLAKYMPLKNYESVIVFCEGATVYNPQGIKKTSIKRKADTSGKNLGHLAKSKDYTQEFTSYPKMTLYFESERGTHPTQKPVALYEYLIRTYTNPGDTVLDICMGSGTTGVACKQTRRNFIGIEKERKYFEIAEKRIAQAQEPLFVENSAEQPAAPDWRGFSREFDFTNPEGDPDPEGIQPRPPAGERERTEGVKWHIQTQALMIVHGGHGTNCAMA
jgi:site-specific DNA-methyltransferase (adenine-specific)